MSVVLVGADPGLTLTRDGGTVAFVSVWRVDWSAHGAGRAIVLWDEGRTTLVTDRPVPVDGCGVSRRRRSVVVGTSSTAVASSRCTAQKAIATAGVAVLPTKTVMC